MGTLIVRAEQTVHSIKVETSVAVNFSDGRLCLRVTVSTRTPFGGGGRNHTIRAPLHDDLRALMTGCCEAWVWWPLLEYLLERCRTTQDEQYLAEAIDAERVQRETVAA